MNKILTFSPASVTSMEVHLAWASLEILADDVDELQIMAAGDDNDVNDLKVEEKAGKLTIEQPTYGLTIKLNGERWMQILIRLPRSWKGAVDANTIAGPLPRTGRAGHRYYLRYRVRRSSRSESVRHRTVLAHDFGRDSGTGRVLRPAGLTHRVR